MSSNYETIEIHDEMNKRISNRNIPSGMLQPYLSVRPVMTKYSLLPIVDPRKANTVKVPIYATYNPEKTFNPGNDTAPWSGYASGVNVESELRNQIFALQRGSQSVYVPPSTSDLYSYQFHPSKQDYQPFPNLFKKEQFDTFNPTPPNMHQTAFQTSTRVNTLDAPIYTDRFGTD
jgi:hypothetical protein